VLHLAMLNKTVREIAQETKQPQATVKALLGGPWAREQLTAYHDRFMAGMQARAFDHTRTLTDKLEEKIAQLNAMTNDENPNVALRAIELWINHAIGSPVKRSEITHKSPLDGLTPAELEFVRDFKRLPTPDERLTINNPAYDIDTTEAP
jgi:hypothetical protein